MRYLILSVILLTGCAVTKPQPELDAIKVQDAIFALGAHVMAIEKKLGIVYPTPTPEANK